MKGHRRFHKKGFEMQFYLRYSAIRWAISGLFCLLLSARLDAQQSAPSTDLATMMALVDQEKYSSLAEAKQLREKNHLNRQLAPLFDFSYALSLMKFGRWQDASDILQPFVDSRPKVHQARLMLIRCLVELDKQDSVIVEADQLLDQLPSDAQAASEVVQTVGLLVGYFKFARKDVPDEIKLRLEQSALKKIPEPLQAKLQESISLVESKVATIEAEIAKAAEKAEASAESKIADNLEEAERLRSEAEANADSLQSREKDRAEKFEQLKLKLNKVELDYGNLTTRQAILRDQINDSRRLISLLERTVTREDKNGNRKTTTEITDQVQYARLNRVIRDAMNETRQVEANMAMVLNNYQQLQLQARGLVDQNQFDELFTAGKMNQLASQAEAREKRADREADRKGKRIPNAARGLHAKLKSYATYDALDIAANKLFLQGIAKRFLPQ